MKQNTEYYEKICKNIPNDFGFGTFINPETYQKQTYDLFLTCEEAMITGKNKYIKNLEQACHQSIIQMLRLITNDGREWKNFWNEAYRRNFDKQKAKEHCKKNNKEYIKLETKYINSLDSIVKTCFKDLKKRFPSFSCPICFEVNK